jgi:hypothetical protein
MDSRLRGRRFIALAVVATAALGAAGCAGDRATPNQPAGPPVAMTGRWLLAAPGQGQCFMTFGGASGAAEGTIAPEGGCPGQFYTSRKWTFEAAGLVVRDHNGQPLAQLAAAGPGRFTGQSTAGAAVTLTR